MGGRTVPPFPVSTKAARKMMTEQHMAGTMNKPGSVVGSSHAASDGFSVSTITVTVLPGPNVST